MIEQMEKQRSANEHLEPVVQAWDEGYRAGVNDERMSEMNIGIAGMGMKVEPARNNPYRTTPPGGRQSEDCLTAAPVQEPNLLATLKAVQGTLIAANEQGLLADTIWFSKYETLFDFIGAEIDKAEQATPPAAPVQNSDHEFKNFHRQLCERFGYTHDEVDWKRDQVSLIEWIAKQVKPAAPAPEERKPAVPLTDEQQIAEALRHHGLTLVKTPNGYTALTRWQIDDHGITAPEQKGGAA